MSRPRFDRALVRDHCGLTATYWLFFAAFNLLTLSPRLRLRSHGRDRGKNVPRTISRLIDELRDDLERFDISEAGAMTPREGPRGDPSVPSTGPLTCPVTGGGAVTI